MRKTVSIIAVVLVIIAFLAFRVITAQQHVAESTAAKGSIVGLTVRDITKEDRAQHQSLGTTDHGVLVSAVHTNGLAEQRGIEIGDVILSINGISVASVKDYEAALDDALVQDAIALRVQRLSGEVTIRLSSGYAAAYNHLGNAYTKDAKIEEAIQAYQKAIAINPELAEAYYNLGNLYAQTSEHEQAVEYYEKALRLRPGFQAAKYQIAEVRAKQGDKDKALETYRGLVNFSPLEAAATDLKPVEVVEASQGELREELELSGTIEPQAKVTIFPKAAGIIEKMPVKRGQLVDEDQPLAMIEHVELSLQLEQVDAGLEAAKIGYEQAKQLAEIRILSQRDQARAGLAAVEAALQQVEDLAETRTETQIDQAQAALNALEANLEKIRRGARDEEREQIRATVAQAGANLSYTRSEYDRLERLLKQGAVSQQTFDGIETQLHVAEEQLAVARQQQKLVENGARPEDIEAMEAQVQQAAAGVRLARAQAERQTWKMDIVMAGAQVEQARAMLTSAEALVTAKSWEAEIAAAKVTWIQARVGRDLLLKQLDDTTVRAPIRGVVSARHLEQGDMAAHSVPLFELVDLDVVHATVSVPESDLPKVRMGGPATIHVDCLSEGLEGEVTAISPTVDGFSRTVEIEVAVDNPKHLLKPGMFAQVYLSTDVRSNVVMLPRAATYESGTNGDRYAFAVRDGRAEKVPVVLGLVQKDLVEVVEGLAAGAQLVIAGQQGLRHGDLVRVVKTAAEE